MNRPFVLHSGWLGHDSRHYRETGVRGEDLPLLKSRPKVLSYGTRLSPPKSPWLKWTASVKVSIRCSYVRSLPAAGFAHFDADSMVALCIVSLKGPRAEGIA